MPIAFPGYVPDVASSGTIDPAWGNAARDRAAQVFDTTANRDAALPSPVTGQWGIITTGTGAGLFVRAGATVGWRAPWNLPWGIVASASVATPQTGITTAVDVTSLTSTFTALANRQYRLSALIQVSGTSGDTVRVLITDGSGTEVEHGQLTFGVTASGYLLNIQALETYAAGSITRKVRAIRQAGTGGTVTVAASNTARLVIEDIGPSGAPS